MSPEAVPGAEEREKEREAAHTGPPATFVFDCLPAHLPLILAFLTAVARSHRLILSLSLFQLGDNVAMLSANKKGQWMALASACSYGLVSIAMSFINKVLPCFNLLLPFSYPALTLCLPCSYPVTTRVALLYHN